MKTLVYLGGAYCFAFALFHLAFWKLFDWKRELPKLRAVNRGVMQVLNLRLTYLFFVFAFISFFYAEDLLSSPLGAALLGAISLGWLMRAAEQPIFWKFDAVSAVFFVLFLIGSALYGIPFLSAVW